MNQQLEVGFVYVQTNDADVNEVVAFVRGTDGKLDRLGAYPTGGKGSGTPHLPSQSSVVLSGGRLYVTNAGSHDVTVFAVDDDQVAPLDRAASGGTAPRSVTVHGNRVFVLNTEGDANVSGFVLEDDKLVPAGGTHALGPGSDPAQVAVSPDGRTLLVTDRATDSIHAFAIAADGALTSHTAHSSAGATPYGFDVTADGVLVVTEAAGAQAGKASASSYRLGRPAELTAVSGPVGNTRSEVCWAVVTNDGRTAFVTNFADGTISSYEIRDDGAIVLREAVAATTVDGEPGIRDEALSADGRYLYALHADSGQVFGWEVGSDLALSPLGSANGLPLTAAGLAAS
jgi:6-phosphogluconolactonase